MSAKTELSAPKRRTRAEVQQLVAEFVSSGMRRSEFCQSRGLSFSTLDRHLKKRRWKKRRRPTSSVGRLVPVELAARKSPTQQEPSCGLAVVLPGGRRIEVHPEFDTNTFERLVSSNGPAAHPWESKCIAKVHGFQTVYSRLSRECPGAGVCRVWIGPSHTDLSGSRGHRH